ncbi:MAG: DNRLRE domain-containing protein [Chloroflexota bacterium]|nr:MAG: DNRLRE domain-containing protein [Chloroflexota bacterium]
MKYRLFVLIVIAFLVAQVIPGSPNVVTAASVKAFPGAVGYGTDTPGGRGGRVIYVTNLNDSGSGSLREALTATGARTVVFKVSGTITLSGDIQVNNPYLTVAGQTAPGEGVQIRGAQIKITTHDIIIRYLKVRSGDESSGSNPADRDAVTLNSDTNVYNIVVDHSTMTWGPDVGGITFLNGARDATVSYSIIGEGLYISRHPEGVLAQTGHSLAMNITELSSSQHPTRITSHHNLITTSSDRNPRIIGGEFIDFVNNVVYNWRDSASQGNPRSVNLINNYYVKGPMTTKSGSLYAWTPKVESGGSLRSGSVYESGNVVDGFTTVRGAPTSVYASSRFSAYSMTGEDTARAAYDKVVADAGANRQVGGANGSFVTRRDSADTRTINNLLNRTGTFYNGVSFGGVGGFPAISWPTLASGTPATDADNDGMADAWEVTYFGNTSRGSSANSSSDLDADGYTDLEEYLNGTNQADGTTLPQPTATTKPPTAVPTATNTSVPPTVAPTKTQVPPTAGPTSTLVPPTVAPTATQVPPTVAPTITTEPTAPPTVDPTPGPGAAAYSYLPVADAMVSNENPGKNYGSTEFLTVDDSPTKQTFLKFEVTGLGGYKVTSAILRIYCTKGSAEGGRLKLAASSNWKENEITWKNRPDVVGDVAGKLGAVQTGKWYEINVTPLISADGTYTFRLHSNIGDNAEYASKEGQAGFAPQLVITTDDND